MPNRPLTLKLRGRFPLGRAYRRTAYRPPAAAFPGVVAPAAATQMIERDSASQ